MPLKDKVALITGGGRGIGKAVALAYAREGARVAICARTEVELHDTAHEIQAIGPECLAIACNVSDEEQVGAAARRMKEHFGRVDVLINNAGVMTRPAPLLEYEVAKWDYTIAVNLRGTFLVTKAILPFMVREKRGSIVNVSSMIGRGAYANFSAYAASKWAIEGLTQTLAAELRPYNIRVNSVDPGYVATKLTGYHGDKPDSVTGVFVFLASDESHSVSGKMLNSSNWRTQVPKT